MAKILIRRSRPGDEGAVVALFAAWPGHERSELRSGLGDWHVHLVAEQDGEVIAYAAVTPDGWGQSHYPETRAMGENWGYLAHLLVRADLRSRGHGRELLSAAEDVARTVGARGLAVNPDGTGDRARLFRFYEQSGYVPVAPDADPDWPYFFREF